MFFDIIFRHRRFVLVGVALFVALAALGLAKLQVSTDNRVFYGENNPYFQDQLEFEREFTSNDNILFVLNAPFTVLEKEYPKAIRWLTDEAARLSHAIRADSLASYPHPTSETDTLMVQSLLEWACPADGPCRKAADSALSEAHLQNRLISPDRAATGVLVTVSVERGAVGEIEDLHLQAKELAKKFSQKFPEIEIYFTGGVPMMAAFAEATADDLSLLLPSALLVIALLLILVLGSVRIALAIVALGLASIVCTLGSAGWAQHTLNNATSIVPLIVFTLVVTSSMHVAVHFSRNIDSHSDVAKAAAQARASLSSSMIPIVISAATSAVSLCSLWFVDSPPLQQLGLLSGLGVLFGLALTIVVLPLLLVRTSRITDTKLNRSIQAYVNSCARRHETGRAPVAVPLALFTLCILGLVTLEVNDDFVEFFDESVPFRVNTDHATDLLAGPNHIEIVLRSTPNTVFEPEFLKHLNALTEWVREQRLVANAHSFSDVMQEVSSAFAGQRVEAVNSAEELAQLFLVYELSLQIGQSNTDIVNAQQDAARISVLLKESTSSEIQRLEDRIYEWHRAHGSPYTLKVTGENIPVAHLSWMNIYSMISGIFLSLSFTALVVGTTFRSLRLGLVALVATVLPVLAGFGAWGWINSEIGIAATAIVALTIGVVVDDATHYIYRFLDARRRLQMDPRSSAGYAIHRAGTAIVSSSIVLGIGLSLLLFSSFEVNSTFGAVACLIIVTALIFVLFLLPRLTTWAATIRRRPQERFA